MRRNPNHYGTVSKLTGTRSKPYAAYMPIINVNGKPKRTPIGYFATEAEARTALADWNKAQSDKINYTLKDLYDDWSARAYPRLTSSTVKVYKAAWKNLAGLHGRKVRELRSWHFQQVVDAAGARGLKRGSLHAIAVVVKALETLALTYDIIQQNYALNIMLPSEQHVEKVPFTDGQIYEIDKQARAGNETAMLTLLMLATGWRISEFFGFQLYDYDAVNKTLTGGVKTKNSKGRVVPIPSYVQPYFDYFYNSAVNSIFPVTADYFRRKMFPTLKLTDGDGTPLTPHATRHTFASLAHRFKLDDVCLRRLLGHAMVGVTEQTYIHVGVNELKTEIEKIDIPAVCQQFVNSL